MTLHNSSKRVFSIIEYLSTKPYATIDEITASTNIPYTTIYRILQTLVRLGYIEFTERSQYRLTHKLYNIMATFVNNFLPISNIAHPYLKKLFYIYGETLHLGILSNNKILYIDKIDSKHRLRMHSHIGFQTEVYGTGLGKALISYLDDNDLASLLNHIPSFVQYTPNTITSKKKLMEQIATIRTQGYAEDLEEHEVGIYCMAVPIFDAHNQVMAAMSMSIPTFRYVKENKMATVKSLWEHAAELSAQFNNRDYYACLKRKA